MQGDGAIVMWRPDDTALWAALWNVTKLTCSRHAAFM